MRIPSPFIIQLCEHRVRKKIRFTLNDKPEDTLTFGAFEGLHPMPVDNRRNTYEVSLDITGDAFGIGVHGLILSGAGAQTSNLNASP